MVMKARHNNNSAGLVEEVLGTRTYIWIDSSSNASVTRLRPEETHGTVQVQMHRKANADIDIMTFFEAVIEILKECDTSQD